MTKPLEIVDYNYVLFSPGILRHLRTGENVSLEDAVARGIARQVEDPRGFYGDKTIEIFKRLLELDPKQVMGAAVAVVLTTGETELIDVSLVGAGADLRAAIWALAQKIDQMDPPAAGPADMLH